MSAQWREVRVDALPGGISASFVVVNGTRETWSPETHFVAWQFFDPETNRFIMEGEWRPIAKSGQSSCSSKPDFAISSYSSRIASARASRYFSCEG